MVHNGIEYGDMQLICEAYHLMKDVLGMQQSEMAQVGAGPGAAVTANLTPPPLVVLVAWVDAAERKGGEPSVAGLSSTCWSPGQQPPPLRVHARVRSTATFPERLGRPRLGPERGATEPAFPITPGLAFDSLSPDVL